MIRRLAKQLYITAMFFVLACMGSVAFNKDLGAALFGVAVGLYAGALYLEGK
jgi:hypothetical protein